MEVFHQVPVQELSVIVAVEPKDLQWLRLLNFEDSSPNPVLAFLPRPTSRSRIFKITSRRLLLLISYDIFRVSR